MKYSHMLQGKLLKSTGVLYNKACGFALCLYGVGHNIQNLR